MFNFLCTLLKTAGRIASVAIAGAVILVALAVIMPDNAERVLELVKSLNV